MNLCKPYKTAAVDGPRSFTAYCRQMLNNHLLLRIEISVAATEPNVMWHKACLGTCKRLKISNIAFLWQIDAKCVTVLLKQKPS